MSLLSSLGMDVKKVFNWFGTPKAQAVISTGEAAVEDVFPALTAVFTLANTWIAEIVKEEALAVAAGQQTGSGTIKAASVVGTLTPQVLAFAAAQGMPVPDAATILTASNGLVAFLNALGAPKAS